MKDRQTIDAIEQTLLEELGEYQFLQALLRQMSYDDKESAFDYIARCYDIEINEEE